MTNLREKQFNTEITEGTENGVREPYFSVLLRDLRVLRVSNAFRYAAGSSTTFTQPSIFSRKMW